MAAPSNAGDKWRDAILLEQVTALFRGVTLGVSAAGLAALFLAVLFMRMDFIGFSRGAGWAAAIIVCAVAHICLAALFRGPRRKRIGLRAWAFIFTAICLAEGLCWGYASTGLVLGNEFVIALMAIAVTIGASAGAIPAFAVYLPAYFAFLVPANLPFVIVNAVSDEPLRQAAAVLLAIFIIAMAGLGVIANRSFRKLVQLRFETEQLAVDLRRQKEVAEQANRAKSSFLAAASHDLRQPVHALGLFIGALRGLSLRSDARRLVEQMEGSVMAMEALFNSLLDISKLDAGVVEARPQPFLLGPLIARAHQEHLGEASAKGLSLRMIPTSIAVHSDPVLIERILRNLVSNAVRYTSRGKVLLGCRRHGSKVRLMVLDTGPGIPPQERERIFVEYYQLGNPERDRAKGLGLGLAIVKRLVDLLSCPLILESRLGHGSRFEVELPRAEQAAAAGQGSSQVDHIMASGFIVVIDDEEPIRAAMNALLSGWGYGVTTAASGSEALSVLADRTQRPDLLLCDYRLRDGENGIDVIERIRSEYNHAIPALLISGDTAPDRLAEARERGLFLLHKPIPNGRLRAAINNLINTAVQEA